MQIFMKKDRKIAYETFIIGCVSYNPNSQLSGIRYTDHMIVNDTLVSPDSLV